MTMTTASATTVRCGRCHWPARRTVTITSDQGTIYSAPTCHACLNSIQQDGRYFTASIQIGPVVADADSASEWSASPRPASMTEEERGRLIYRVAADVGQALSNVPGWQVERSGVCMSIRFKGHGIRKHGDPPDYLIWVEDATDLHLHKVIESSVRRQLAEEQQGDR